MNKILLSLLLAMTLSVVSLQAQRGLKLQQMKIEQRVALVIGNNTYTSKKLNDLQNPINDAKAMRSKLKSLGFTVFYGENLNVRDMDKQLRSFNSKLRQGGVGLFFFAGHGVESQGKNYLMGKDSNLIDKLDIAYESLELNKVLDTMKNSGNRLNIVLLDACRNDPFSRSGGGGLAKVDNAKGMFIAYATSPGDVASDGSGKHGVFTEQVLNHIDVEGLPIGRMFKRVKRSVYDKTQQMQRPWTHDDLIGDFFFKLPQERNTNTQVKKNPLELKQISSPALKKKTSINDVNSIDDIRTHYYDTRKKLSKYSTNTYDDNKMSSKGAKLQVYRNQNNSIPLIRSNAYGNKTKVVTEYYFKDNQVYFVFQVTSKYTSANKTSQEENRYYFLHNKLVRWLDKNKSKVTLKKQTEKKEKELLQQSYYLIQNYK